MTAAKQKAYARGHKGEGLAALYLRLKGYRILEKRFKTPVGEADLIARKGKTLAFIEVKARETYAQGVEAVTRHQQKRVMRAAEYFLAHRDNLHGLTIRFDVIVALPGLRLRHIKNAWGA